MAFLGPPSVASTESRASSIRSREAESRLVSVAAGTLKPDDCFRGVAISEGIAFMQRAMIRRNSRFMHSVMRGEKSMRTFFFLLHDFSWCNKKSAACFAYKERSFAMLKGCQSLRRKFSDKMSTDSEIRHFLLRSSWRKRRISAVDMFN